MRRMLSFLVPLVAALTMTPFAFAAWITNGAGTGSATATSVKTGNSPEPDWGDGTVLLTWAATTLTSGAPVGYYDVIRDGDTSAPVCSHVEATNCIDEDPVPGPVSYAVIPRIGANWVGPTSESTRFQYDVFAPTTSLAERTPDANSDGWNKDDVLITLHATDPAPVASGVEEIHYVLDGVATVVPGDTATFKVAEEKVSSLKYWAVDYLGNEEGQTPAEDVKVDKTAPTTGFAISPTPNSLGWSNADVTITLTPSDAVSGVISTEYSLTGGATWTPYPTAGISITSEGTHTILYRSTDLAGNVEDPESGTVRLDKTAPNSSAILTGSNVTLSAGDSGSGVAAILYKIGSAPTYTAYTQPFPLAGGQTVTFHAVDAAGNLESPDNTLTAPSGDVSGPSVNITGPTGDVNNKPGQGTGRWNQVCFTSGGAGVCGTATDVSGIAQVQIKLQRASDSACWTGNTTGTIWSTSACSVWLAVTGSTSWYRAIPYNVIAGQSLTLSARATDGASPANTSTPVTKVFAAE